MTHTVTRAATVGLILATAAALGGGCSGKKEPGEGGGAKEIDAKSTKTVPLDPFDKAWNDAIPVVVDLMPQGVAFPMLQEVKIPKLSARALVDKDWLGILLEWEDKTKSERLQVDEFTDGVAIELPLGDLDKTNPMMGSAENPVYLAHWKAAWQVDVDRGRRTDVQDYHPGFWSDPYPFVAGGYPYPVQEAFESPNARRYLPGVAAGNPVSKLYREYPVEELQAEGFSTLADHQMQNAKAKGVHKDGKWRVVIALPRAVADAANPKLPEKSTQKVAFAVWDGGAGNVAGRKQWYPFVTLNLP
ncbi:MAG TPA: ethylbenzene dehydrogenase-related protein [Polyangiaceae bacterium]|nr:ethylbenzene dehydrogenase-related protein [Polyangiaceae bacterium]